MQKGSGKAKITDKQRLDWLAVQNEHMSLDFDLCSKFKRGIGCSLTDQAGIYATPRQAIDAAIRASKPRPARGKAERGK